MDLQKGKDEQTAGSARSKNTSRRTVFGHHNINSWKAYTGHIIPKGFTHVIQTQSDAHSHDSRG